MGIVHWQLLSENTCMLTYIWAYKKVNSKTNVDKLDDTYLIWQVSQYQHLFFLGPKVENYTLKVNTTLKGIFSV